MKLKSDCADQARQDGRQEAMRQSGTIELYQYWNRLRRGRPAPTRAEIEPADIRALLADTFILEIDSRGHAIFRLAGTRLCAAFGRELKGYSFAALWRGSDQAAASRLLRGVASDKTLAVMAMTGVTASGRRIAFEMVLLPLDGGTETPRLLGAAFPFERPFWMGSEALTELRLDTVRVLDPDRDHVFLDNRPSVPVPDMAPRIAELSADPAGGPRKVRHLVVLDGGRQH